MKKKSKLEELTEKQIKEITKRAESKRNVQLVKSSQVNMRLSPEVLEKAMKLAEARGIPYTTFLTTLIKEDIDRLWSVFEKAG